MKTPDAFHFKELGMTESVMRFMSVSWWMSWPRVSLFPVNLRQVIITERTRKRQQRYWFQIRSLLRHRAGWFLLHILAHALDKSPEACCTHAGIFYQFIDLFPFLPLLSYLLFVLLEPLIDPEAAWLLSRFPAASGTMADDDLPVWLHFQDAPQYWNMWCVWLFSEIMETVTDLSFLRHVKVPANSAI